MSEWADDINPGLPRPEGRIDESWEPAKMFDVEFNSKHGFFVAAPLHGYKACLICGKPVLRGLILTDGVFIWRSEVAHNVGKHCVRPPQKFIGHVNVVLNQIESFDESREWWAHNLYEDSPTSYNLSVKKETRTVK
jgi:hypothetical protein